MILFFFVFSGLVYTMYYRWQHCQGMQPFLSFVCLIVINHASGHHKRSPMSVGGCHIQKLSIQHPLELQSDGLSAYLQYVRGIQCDPRSTHNVAA